MQNERKPVVWLLHDYINVQIVKNYNSQ